MKRRVVVQIAYWVLILIFLTFFFGNKWESQELAFYFSCMLLPIVIGTSYFFNRYLVPKYLLTKKYRQFAIYFLYMLIVSLYLEIVVALFSFVVLANSNVDLVNLEGISIFNLGITMYLIVFATSFIRLIIEFQQKIEQLDVLKTKEEINNQHSISIRADRRKQVIQLNEILYVESLNDFVKIVRLSDELMTREKISKIHERLPEYFVRIHRSFVINSNFIQSFNNSEVEVNGTRIPISRTYKSTALETLRKLPKI